MTETRSVVERITEYLCGGGLFNPEEANHDAVRDLLIDCRAALATSPPPRPASGGRMTERNSLLRAVLVPIVSDAYRRGRSEKEWDAGVFVDAILRAVDEFATPPLPAPDPDLFLSDARQILCRVFDEEPDDLMARFAVWYEPSKWFNGYRALGAFIRLTLEVKVRPVVTEAMFADATRAYEQALADDFHAGNRLPDRGKYLRAALTAALRGPDAQ